MILVLLGTQNNSFCRLLKEIEQNIDSSVITEEVIVQAGYTKYKSEKMKIFDFLPKDELNELIKNASYIISHGGIGSMMMANENGKKVIAVARLKKYKEHVNNHQVSTVKAFAKRGYVIEADGVENLTNAINKLKDFKLQIYEKEENKIVNIIEEFIENN